MFSEKCIDGIRKVVYMSTVRYRTRARDDVTLTKEHRCLARLERFRHLVLLLLDGELVVPKQCDLANSPIESGQCDGVSYNNVTLTDLFHPSQVLGMC